MQGTLQDFRIAEILQLVAGQQKTGLLRVESHGKLLTFYFERGTLVSCRDRRHTGRDPLADYVGRYGIVDRERAEQLARECEERKVDFAARLLDEHLIDAETLRLVLDDLAQELVYRTFDWRDGTYRFILGEEFLHGLQHRISHTVESLLMEAARRADEWPRLRLRIPGPQVLVDAQNVPADLDPHTRGFLARLSTPTRVGDLVATSRIPEYDVYEILFNAIDAGIVRILEIPAAPPAEAAIAATFVDEDPVSISSVVVWVLAVSTFVLCTSGGLMFASHWRSRPPAAIAAEVHADQARHELVSGLETYRALMGRYPEQLPDLESHGIVPAVTIAAAGVRTYACRSGDRFDIDYLPAERP